MIQTAITAATEEIPKLYEPGWDWWAWPIAWTALALAALIIAAAAPLFVVTVEAIENHVLRVSAAIGVILLVLAAVVAGYAGSGVMMRHMDNGEGAFWVALGSILVGVLGWGVGYYLYDSRNYSYEDRHWVSWASAAPALVIGLGAVLNGIAEIITRLAASIPMTVVQFLTVIVLGSLAFFAFAASPSRR
jgi:hypothetical protein